MPAVEDWNSFLVLVGDFFTAFPWFSIALAIGVVGTLGGFVYRWLTRRGV